MNPAYETGELSHSLTKKKKKILEEKRRIPLMAKVCSACWGLIKAP